MANNTLKVQDVVRGSAVHFSAQFRAANGQSIAPNSAALTVSYDVEDVAKSNSIAMVYNSNTTEWTATWTSNNCDLGVVYWNVTSAPPSPVSVEGSFRVKANPATVIADPIP